MNDLGVLNLLGARDVGGAGPGEGARNPQPGRGQAELAVERGQVLAYVVKSGPGLLASSGITTVSPLPSIPLRSSDATP
jgi:hypothetical protein